AFSLSRSVYCCAAWRHLFCAELVDALVLPSFPTRRSSDLGLKQRFTACEFHDWEGSSSRCVSHWSSYSKDFLPNLSDWNSPPNRDRKSTRLNSSHLGMSYAVFRLNKTKTYATT